jgi:hypothetical protein
LRKFIFKLDSGLFSLSGEEVDPPMFDGFGDTDVAMAAPREQRQRDGYRRRPLLKNKSRRISAREG